MASELYNSLKAMAGNEAPELKKLCARLKMLDKEGHTLVFCLIQYHNSLYGLPPISLKEQVEINLKTFNAGLLCILDKFSLLHAQKMSENFERTFSE